MLIPIEDHVLDMPRRVKEVDPALHIFFNTKTQKFEVHDALAKGGTYVMSAGELDERLITRLHRGRLSNHVRDILRELESADEERERIRRRNFRNLAESLAEELKWAERNLYRMGV